MTEANFVSITLPIVDFPRSNSPYYEIVVSSGGTEVSFNQNLYSADVANWLEAAVDKFAAEVREKLSAEAFNTFAVQAVLEGLGEFVKNSSYEEATEIQFEFSIDRIAERIHVFIKDNGAGIKKYVQGDEEVNYETEVLKGDIGIQSDKPANEASGGRGLGLAQLVTVKSEMLTSYKPEAVMLHISNRGLPNAYGKNGACLRLTSSTTEMASDEYVFFINNLRMKYAACKIRVEDSSGATSVTELSPMDEEAPKRRKISAAPYDMSLQVVYSRFLIEPETRGLSSTAQIIPCQRIATLSLTPILPKGKLVQ